MSRPVPARVLLLTDRAMADHAATGHPERPERLEAAAQGVTDGALAADAALDRPAVEAADDLALQLVHPAWYLETLDAAAARGGGWVDPDTYLGPRSMAAARLAAGATLQGAVAVASGHAEVAFAVVRPPGHHAAAERAAGFCLVNNVAVAAAGLRQAGLAQRIAIVDWDVHHGDGTQAIFDADSDLCYASTHQSPLYPGTGAASELGSGTAQGTKHNEPLPPGSGDAAFTEAWLERLLPAVEAFRPEAILASAGYDAHRDDPLANLEVTEAGYATVTQALGEVTRRLGIGGVTVTLEGGYDLRALRASVAASVTGLLAGLRG
jgi:acetoin utilization deacetylase AcuC-like enzyme